MTETARNTIQSLVASACEAERDYFGWFHAEKLSRFLNGVHDVITRFSPEVLDPAGVVESTIPPVMAHMKYVAIRTLVSLYREQRGGVDALGFDAFHKMVSTPEGRSWAFEAYPELNRLLELTVNRSLAGLEAVLEAAAADRATLRDALGARGPITSVALDLGDSHCGGTTVSLVHWQNGVTGVHKPRQGVTQELLEDLCATIDPNRAFFGPLHPHTVAMDGYAWQEFIEHSDVPDRESLADYFRKLGRISALYSMLGATDLHHENVVSTSAGPVLIDVETITSLPSRSTTSVNPVALALSADLAGSVLNTLLLPSRYLGSMFDFDLSGVGTVQSEQSKMITSFQVVDAGTDDIRFDQVPAGIQHGRNLATVDGEPARPPEWAGEIQQGYREAHGLCRDRRRDIEAVLRSRSRWSVRHVPRPTFVYTRFLEASTHPTYLRAREHRRELLEKLPAHYAPLSEETSGEVKEAEVNALLDLDIPYFTFSHVSGRLQGNQNAMIEGAVDGSAPEIALGNIDRYFSRPVERDLTYIEYAFSSAVDDAWENRASRNGAASLGRRTFTVHDAHSWHAGLAETVLGPVESGESTLLMPVLSGAGFRMSPLNLAVYEGGGLLVYLAERARRTAELPPELDASALFNGAEFHPVGESVGPFGLSPFTGNLADTITGIELARRGATLSRAMSFPLVTSLDRDIETLSVDDFDYLNGLSGYLSALAEYPGQQRADRFVDRLADRLLELDGGISADSTDLALSHGRTGRLVALSAALAMGRGDTGAIYDHVSEAATTYLRERPKDSAVDDSASRHSWCKGYAGIAFGMAKVLGRIGSTDEQIMDMLEPEIDAVGDVGTRPGGDISFCHGLAGRVAVLCWLADRLRQPDLRERARELSAVHASAQDPAEWGVGAGRARHLPSFMLGLSSWHYSRLMLDEDGTELPLCLGGGR